MGTLDRILNITRAAVVLGAGSMLLPEHLAQSPQADPVKPSWKNMPMIA